MADELELTKIKSLMVDIYRRYRNKELTKEEARCESELLKGIVDTIEIARVKDQIAQVKSLLISNKRGN
jgi:hypothetical protein